MADITVLTGFLAGRKISLDTEVFFIGRQASNDLELPDLSISRQHCVIEMQNAGRCARFLIRDLASANGVKVNDQTVTERELRHGDRIQIGDCLLRFDEEESRVTLSECAGAMESTFQLGPADVRSLQSGAAPGAMPETERYRDDLRALLEISVAVGGLRSVSEIQTCFLNRIVPRIPADYAAAIPIVSPELEQSLRRASQVRRVERVSPKDSSDFGVSRTVLDRVLQTEEAILAGPVKEEKFLTEAESILRSGTQAVIAAPAFSDTGLVGILYLASTVVGAFDAYHLRLAAAAAGILGVALKRVLVSEELERDHARLLSRVRIRHQIVGASPEIAKVLNDIQRISSTDSTVLILGETGTGKELVAQALHDNSPRASRPLVAFNCAAFSESLIESELFGHERGAFSGAIALKRGLFEQAQGSTLFLDEIGELHPPLQAKLLRVLESREIRRLGGEKPIPVDFRLITATHRNLREAVKAGSFRSDLYYRLDIVSIPIPPLRDRRRDILPLAEHFLAQFRGKTSRQLAGFAGSAKDYLVRYDWPGNVRELRNAVERAVIAGASPYIEIEDLPDSLAASPVGESESIPYRQSLLEARRRIILAAFEAAEGKHIRAAQLLGVHANNLHRMLNELGLREQVRRVSE
jgi:transcriptional regulator with GAF, ATPase, and Fis domain